MRALMALPAGAHAGARDRPHGRNHLRPACLSPRAEFWLIAATHIVSFWSYLLGVCRHCDGPDHPSRLVANPYTTVLGPKEYGAFRINLAQTVNGVGGIVGAFIGGAFFYSHGGT